MLTSGVLWAARLQQHLEAFAPGGALPHNSNSAQSLTKALTQSGRATAF
jgi:hypothetical protein